MVRTLRTAPTSVGRFVWNTDISLVRPPSTCSTYTMSAPAMPYCGSPAEVLSILTATTGPCTSAPPVSGSVGGGGGGGSGVGAGVGAGVGLGVGDGEGLGDGLAEELGRR